MQQSRIMSLSVNLDESCVDRAFGFVRFSRDDCPCVDVDIAMADQNELYGLIFSTIFELAEIKRMADFPEPNTTAIKLSVEHLIELFQGVQESLEDGSALDGLDNTATSESQCTPSEAI